MKNLFIVSISVIIIVAFIYLGFQARRTYNNIKNSGACVEAIILDTYYLRSTWKTKVLYQYSGIRYTNNVILEKKHHVGDTVTVKISKISPGSEIIEGYGSICD
ncbi:hypothetical protein [Hymenobacter lapidiphilus]|uniref:DUF3592 domain-containing protein n=1 Tax=Hymenobacter lapidiphilus TaxID=2608003 RepID=A0A7Y7U6T2_9BACT|nr:hypothetical protein [Hymenobacter lapidiphilus]NVO33136.1 hypothetical protein [Hymenobacter lapidiphilus]